MKFTGIPIVGNIDGKPANLLLNTEGFAQVSHFIDTIGGSSTAWVMAKVDAISKSPTGFLCLGSGVTNTGSTTHIAWVNNSGSWQVGPSGINSNLRATAVIHDGSKFIVAAGNSIYESLFTYQNLPPAGGFASTAPTNTMYDGGDSIAFGSVPVITSLTMSRSWSGPNYTFNSDGLNVGLPATTYSTTYTFPGSTLTNPKVQKVFAKPTSNTPPTVWGDYTLDPSLPENESYQGYYGIIGGTAIKVSWSE